MLSIAQKSAVSCTDNSAVWAPDLTGVFWCILSNSGSTPLLCAVYSASQAPDFPCAAEHKSFGYHTGTDAAE